MPEIETAPIYYISLHGSYEMQKYLDGSEPIDTLVPENTLVIETSNIGESCYFVNFIKVMEPLLSDRVRFLQYLKGTPPADDPEDVKQKTAKAFSSCHIYSAGSTIPNRFLTAETGRRNAFHMKSGVPIKEGARASEYGKYMRFSRHDLGKAPVHVLEDVHRRLIEEVDAYETYKSIFARISKTDTDLKIIIFPLCGTIFPTNPKVGVKADAAAIKHIADLQVAADTRWSSIIGRSLNDVSKEINANYRGPTGVQIGTQFVGRDKYSVSGPVPKRGGSRKSLRKFKKTRKNKIHMTKKSL
jgi:hypothetical protein